MPVYDTTIRGGTLVTASGSHRADLGITAGRIAAIEDSLAPGAVDIDATGLYLLPGGVDSHCHIEQKTSTGLTPCDDFYTASISAIAGGTTTLVPFACQHRGQRIRDVVAEYRATAAKAACDYALHVIVTDPAEPHASADLAECLANGISSLKVYMTYDALKLNDEELLDVLVLCRTHGAMVMVHAESHDMIAWITKRLLAAGQVGGAQLPIAAGLGKTRHQAPLSFHGRRPVPQVEAKFHAVARPGLAEREATHRAVTFAEVSLAALATATRALTRQPPYPP